jgi:hypothetical protein
MRIFSLFILVFAFTVSAFAQSGGVKGRVISEATEKSLSGVDISLEQDGKKLKSARSDGKGGFYFDGLADGIYSLVFDKDGYSRSSIRFEVKKSKITDLTNRRLALPADKSNFVTIQGSVFDKNGFSLPGAKVSVERLTGGNVWEKLKTIYSGQDGEFIFRFPPLNKQTQYRVSVAYLDLPAQVKEKTADFAGIYRLVFNFDVQSPGVKPTDRMKDQ